MSIVRLPEYEAEFEPEVFEYIVDKAVEKPFMGIFGTEKVNVLKLNAALEKAK